MEPGDCKVSVALIITMILWLLLATPVTPATTSQSLQLVVRTPTTVFAAGEAIDLNLVFLNAGSDTLVLLRPKPEQMLEEGEWDLRVRVWGATSARRCVLEPSIAYSLGRTLSKSDFVSLSPGDSLVYPVRFGRGRFDMNLGPACDWDVFSAAPVRGADRQDVVDRNGAVGQCFGEAGRYGIRFELGVGEFLPLRGKDLPLERLWRGYVTTKPLIIQVTKPRPSPSEPTRH